MSEFNVDRFEEIASLIISLQDDPAMEDELNTWLSEHSDALRAAADAKGATERARSQVRAIAQGLPLIAAGIQGAVKGFQNQDPLAGSAAVVEVVGNMVNMISSMISSSAGPPGAIVGSILSIFSMILKAFSKQKPEKSIEEKLQSVLDTNNAKTLRDNLEAVQNVLKITIQIVDSLDKANTKYELTEIQGLGFKDMLLPMSNAGVWISKNQNIEHWEAVLVAYCYAHISIVKALVRTMSIAQDHKGIEFLKIMLDALNKDKLKFIKKIKPAARNQGTIWAIRDRSLNGGKGVVFKRNVVVSHKKDWQVFPIDRTPLSFAVSKRTADTQNGNQGEAMALFTLDHTYPFVTHIDWVREKAPLLDHPFRKDDNASKGHGIIYAWYGTSPLRTDVKKHTLSPSILRSKSDYLDIWALPSPVAGEIYLYTAEGNAIVFWTQGSKEHPDDKETKLLYVGEQPMPEGYKVGAVRAVSPKSFDDEIDIISNDTFHAIYGACEVSAKKTKMIIETKDGVAAPPYWDRDHMEIKVTYRLLTVYQGKIQMPERSFIVAPWPNFVGIGVDTRYLWVYKAGAIACATHTEVYTSLIEGLTQPPWIIYNIPHKVGESEYDPTELSFHMDAFYPLGLIDLSPCDDGTLTALYFEKDKGFWQAPVYSMTPQIDRVARTLKIEGMKRDSHNYNNSTNGWESDRTLWVSRVIKQPIDCWPLLIGLEKMIESQYNTKRIDETL